MSDNVQFVSVLSPATANGTITFTLTTYNADTDDTFVGTVNVSSGDTEEAIAIKIKAQLDTQLTADELQFTSPTLSSQSPEFKFSVNRSEHVITIFSEAQFTLTLADTGSGANLVKTSSAPIFQTLAVARTYGPLYKQSFTDSLGNDLSDETVIAMLAATSAEICAALNNQIVLRTYVHIEITNLTDYIFVKKTPVLRWERPVIRGPFELSILGNTALIGGADNFQVDNQSGEVSFRQAQPFVHSWGPFDKNNEFRMAYVAGNAQIPEILKSSVYQWSSMLSASGNIKDLSGGTFRVSLRDPKEEKASILRLLDSYRMPL